MNCQEPVVQFIPIEVGIAIGTTGGTCGPTSYNPSSCDDTVYADLEICSCWGSSSDVVTQIGEPCYEHTPSFG